MSSPIKDSLYTDTLYKMLLEARERGEEILKFEDVDKRVVELSKNVIKWEVEEEESDKKKGPPKGYRYEGSSI